MPYITLRINLEQNGYDEDFGRVLDYSGVSLVGSDLTTEERNLIAESFAQSDYFYEKTTEDIITAIGE